MSYKRQKVDPDRWTVLHGKEKHELEMVPGVLDVWFEWHADRDCSIAFLYTDGKKIPYANGLHGRFNVQTFNLLSILIECTKATTVAVEVQYRDMAVKEKLDFTKLVITPPAPAMLKLQQMVRQEIARMTGGEETIEVGDEDNLEFEDDSDELDMAVGYMEDEEPAPLPKASKADKKPRPAVEPVSDVNPDGDTDSGVGGPPKAAE